MMKYPDFSILCGLTMESIMVSDAKDEIIFVTTAAEKFRLCHSQDCCESVTVEDIVGDLCDLVGSPILNAEEATSRETPIDIEDRGAESQTWTFYKLSTIKGSVTIRWFGESNGYYSESVDFEKFEGEPE